MGVPAFFRWLTKKYPSIVVEAIDEMDEQNTPIDSSQPNPNFVEFDNLYLDMNGIIHPCTHPENKPAPKNEDEMMLAIFSCVDRLFGIVRPRKILYMAIDGVAPRAKMNQQRSRRFRASKETAEKVIEVEKLKEEILKKGGVIPPEKERSESFDSNCITPGTPFMDRLADFLNYYVKLRMAYDPGWAGVTVILSDSNVPGEGEHKIVDFIRKQRAMDGYNPNTQHCLCGADADLIMLGLATHEANFTIIREEFNYGPAEKPCDICGQKGHEMKDCRGLERVSETSGPIPISTVQKYIFVRLNVLREYLLNDLKTDTWADFDFERALDDWVCLCFFVGNDFLPHLPSLEIRENAIDLLINIYKSTVTSRFEYLTDSGDLDLNKVKLIMSELAQAEDKIFQKRQRNELMFRQRNKDKKENERLTKIEDYVRDNKPVPAELLNTPEEEEQVDDVKLWEPGYKNRYYRLKFNFSDDDIENRKKLAISYVEGLCWVLKYYYQGCCDWKWYFHYHYAPFASDLINISTKEIDFDTESKPFTPNEQLMSVFPAASKSHVPEAYAVLMYSEDSPILDFYPDDFMIDLNGKKYAWQGVALLPFVDETRLKSALETKAHLLTADEITRNRVGTDQLYINIASKCYDEVKLFVDDKRLQELNFTSRDGYSGIISTENINFPNPQKIDAPIEGLRPILNNTVICVSYQNPVYPTDYKFMAKRLEGATEPEKVLKPSDYPRGRGYRPQIGMTRLNSQGHFGQSGHRELRFHLHNPRDEATRPQYGGRGRGFHGRFNGPNMSVNSYHRPQFALNSRGGRGRGSDEHNSYGSTPHNATGDARGNSYSNRGESRFNRPSRGGSEQGYSGYSSYNSNSNRGGPRPTGFYNN